MTLDPWTAGMVAGMLGGILTFWVAKVIDLLPPMDWTPEHQEHKEMKSQAERKADLTHELNKLRPSGFSHMRFPEGKWERLTRFNARALLTRSAEDIVEMLEEDRRFDVLGSDNIDASFPALTDEARQLKTKLVGMGDGWVIIGHPDEE